MIFDFYKYQGTGNDFVMIDDRNNIFPVEDKQYIAKLCNRRFGIGADGLILLKDKENYDFEMIYFNSDGGLSSMCGNGGRCAASFAKFLGIINDDTTFLAADGKHKATFKDTIVSLQMANVNNVENEEGDFILNTGSPHYVRFVDQLENFNILTEAHSVRYSDRYAKEGINVNFIEPVGDTQIKIRSYERGVEDETLSCGTGATASALAFYQSKYEEGGDHSRQHMIEVITTGGSLYISFEHIGIGQFKNIWLSGPAEMVYSGQTLIH